MNSFFICATQYENLGDLMINKMLVDELCKYGKVFIDFSLDIPDNFKNHLLENSNAIDIRKQYGFSARLFSFKSLYKYICLLKQEKINLITRSPGPLGEPSFKVSVGISLLNLLGRVLGSKVIYFGNCCSEAFVKSLSLKTTFMNEVLVRSKETVEFAKNNLKCPVSYIPDMAFLMCSPTVYKKDKIVIVDFRVSDSCDEFLSDLKTIVNKFLNQGYKVELYYQVNSDKEAVISLFEQIKTEGVTVNRNLLWYNDIENYYSNKAYVISNRLHSLLFGAAYGVIPIARISTDPKLQKIKHVFESSMPEIFYKCIDIQTPIDIDSIIHNEDGFRSKLVSAMEKNKEICSNKIAECISKIS